MATQILTTGNTFVMKTFAKLTIFFSLTFAFFFMVAILIRFVFAWIDAARIISETGAGEGLAEIIRTAIPAALYFSILLTLGYSARKNIPIPVTVIGIVVLGFVFTIGISVGIERVDALKSVFKPASPVHAGPGLIVSRPESAIVLLRESRDIRGPRLVSFLGQPFIYQEVPLGPNNTIINLPALSFGEETPWFINSIGIDLSISAREFKNHFEAGFLYFAAYAFSLILLLSSLRFILELSQWPLANIFIGALVFRLILSLEIFLNSREINDLIGSFLDGRAPPQLITALVFGAMSVLIIIYTLLAGIVRTGSKSRRSQSDEN